MLRLVVLVVSLFAAVITSPSAPAAEPIGRPWALDAPGERIAFHYADGTISVYYRGLATPITSVQGSTRIDQLLLNGDTLVAAGPGSTWVWRLDTGRLLHQLPPSEALALSEDGRHLATSHLLIEVGIPQPISAWPTAADVAFSEDGTKVATLHGEQAVLREVPPAMRR